MIFTSGKQRPPARERAAGATTAFAGVVFQKTRSPVIAFEKYADHEFDVRPPRAGLKSGTKASWLEAPVWKVWKADWPRAARHPKLEHWIVEFPNHFRTLPHWP